jgi:hypothetical protein
VGGWAVGADAYTYCSPTRRAFVTGRFPVHISGFQADICSNWSALSHEGHLPTP